MRNEFKQKTVGSVPRVLPTACAVVLAALIALPAVGQDAEGGPGTVEIVRSGIPHDALFDLEMKGETGIAVGAFGAILETTDSGETWTPTPALTPVGLLAVASASNTDIIVGQSGTVIRREGGGDWVLLDSGFEQRLLNVAVDESGLVFVVGEFGFIARSTDNGSTWEPIVLDWMEYNDEGYEPHLYDVVIIDENNIVIAGEFGIITWSEDGGDTFTPKHRGDESVFELYWNAAGTGTSFAVGQDGLVLRSRDGGQTWGALEVPTESNLLGVWAGNDEVVVVGIRALLRSSDDGDTWTAADDLDIVRNWYQGIDAGVAEISSPRGFLRTQIVYVAGYHGTISRVMR